MVAIKRIGKEDSGRVHSLLMKIHIRLLSNYCQKGSLDDVFNQENDFELSDMFAFALSRDILSGLEYLHTHVLLKHHGNLKPSNCPGR